jgi:hypothetical protein
MKGTYGKAKHKDVFRPGNLKPNRMSDRFTVGFNSKMPICLRIFEENGLFFMKHNGVCKHCQGWVLRIDGVGNFRAVLQSGDKSTAVKTIVSVHRSFIAVVKPPFFGEIRETNPFLGWYGGNRIFF